MSEEVNTPQCPPKVKELAAKVIEFFGDDESKWTKGLLARDSQGRAAGPTARLLNGPGNEPVCWCVLGASWVCEEETGSGFKELSDSLGHRFAAIMEQRLGKPFYFSVGAANDHPLVGFEDVIAVLKEIAE